MKRVRILTESELKELENGYKRGAKHHFRVRCQAIILSNENVSVAEISRQLKRDKDTIYSLINKYNCKGIEGLKNKPGQGLKATLSNLSTQQKKTLKQAVDAEPQNLNKVSALLSQKFGFRVSKWMLIQYLKKTKLFLA